MKFGLKLLAIIGFSAGSADARFIESDADLVDQEERFNTETYNDKYSYRFPVSWNDLYEAADAAVRLHAGSLNVNRFDYSEELKFFAANDVAGFSFKQMRQEDVIEQSTVREVRMNGFLPGKLYVSMVADGGSFKEYGDMGWALGLGDVKRPSFELVYWSTDHFYDTKKSDEQDKRTRKTWTLTTQANADLTESLAVSLGGEFDHPLRWQRPSRGYTYEHVRRAVTVGAKYRLTGVDRILFEAEWDRKAEKKTWQASGFSKKMDRDVRSGEVSWINSVDRVDHAAGIAYIYRHAAYEHTNPAEPADATVLPEPFGPDVALRHEWIGFATRNTPLTGDRHYQQYGLFLNYVDLDDTRHVKVMESKAQWAWEYRYTAKARVLLNTTWDVNQLTDDFPYKKRPFRPWGGGDIQFIAAF